MRCVILTRVSTKLQTSENSHSLQEQLESCRAFAAQHNIEVLAELEEVGSGAALSRPILDEALRVCRTQNAVVLVKSLSRLSRRVTVVAELLEANTRFVVVELGMRELSAFECHLYISFCAEERARTSARVKAGMRQARLNGSKLGNPRLAEARIKATQSTVANGVANRARIMAVITEIQEAGVTKLAHIARCLNARGVTTARGKAFSVSSVHYIIKRESEAA